MRLLALVTDAYGVRGGIAKFNRDMLRALCAHAAVTEVVALPRLMPEAPGDLPERLTYRTGGLGGKVAYARSVLASVRSGPRFDAVVCGHIYMLPLACEVSRLLRVPVLLVIHGIDAWEPRGRGLSDRYVRGVDAVVAVSEFTKERVRGWSGGDPARAYVVPNCGDASELGPAPKPDYLLDRYALRGRKVLLTVARLSAKERYKGHDQVMTVMQDLVDAHPELAYLIVGDGDDRARLEARAAWLGIRDRVVFAGHVAEGEKADHYRLADAFVMPGRKEGFGIVYLEALACGIPVIASTADASREAVLDGVMGQLVDPDDTAGIGRAIVAALGDERRAVHPQLDRFSAARFDERWQAVLDAVLAPGRVAPDRRSLVPA